MNVLALFILLIVFISISLPIGIALGLATVLTLTFFSNIPTMMIAQNSFAGLDSFLLMAIPFFILAGNLMEHAGISKRLIDLCNSLVGFITGGLAMVTVFTCMFFAAISGSGPATVSAIGSFMIPAMKEHKYDVGYASAVTASAGTIGVIIPPSIPFVIYAVATGTSIGALFIAGVIPGILIGISLMTANYIMAKKLGYTGTGEKPSVKRFIHSLKDAIFSLLVPVIILGGIYGGIFTPTEAAVVGVFYALLIGLFIHKELNYEKVLKALKDTALINGATTFMVGLSLSFANYLTMAQVPAKVANFFVEFNMGYVGVLITIIILAPILLPVVTKVGIDPVHFGVIMTVALAIGFVTPPYGANLFVASGVARVPLERIIKYIMPFIIAMTICLILISFIPWLSMYLPGILMK